MENYGYIFVDTPNSSAKILGREARQYVLGEFVGEEHVLIEAATRSEDWREQAEKQISEHLKADTVNVVLTLDMPLVRKENIPKIVRKMRSDGINSLRLGRGGLSRIVIGDREERGVFWTDEDFFVTDSAKNFNLVYNALKHRILQRHLEAGVVIYDTATVFIDDTVSIESGAQILPFTRLLGDTHIESGASVSASYVRDSYIAQFAEIENSHIVDSRVCARATVGPFARLRGARIGEGCRIGDFVEVKASELASGVKCAHLSYIGDAEVGSATNVGCGTVFCNYDGKNKNRTKVGSGCFIGANTNLIAPLSVGDNAFIAAGTTVDKDVSDGIFAIGRVRQENKNRKNDT